MGLIADAFDLWREARDAYDEVLIAAYVRAEEATNGRLLNDRGVRANIDAITLFMGPELRARAYASEELRDWWEQHPRLTFEDFERQWAAAREREWAS
ncbi:MAG: hypothetical protein IJO71_12665 [Microbacterium sp.]|uniref:hypothetical protein n=1 Tax=Microbacterium sp. TaxID=51671 RepID=UPI0025EB3A1B|nr:hypothetical protein [Microbacterium sp.]MBQ9918036.1 hypothetical protein [Microbacterium sp.]